MLTFQVAKSSFPAERGSGVALKCWVKEAKCQVVTGGFTAMFFSWYRSSIWLRINLRTSLCPQIDEICLMGRERQLAALATVKKEEAREVSWQLRRTLVSWACSFCCWVAVGKMHFLPPSQHLSYPNPLLCSSSDYAVHVATCCSPD